MVILARSKPLTSISPADFANGHGASASRVMLRLVSVPGWPVAFRGSLAIAAGVLTRDQLRGSRYLRLFPDTYVPVRDQPPDLMLRSFAAFRYVEGRGVLSGYSAAELLTASCGPEGAPAEVTVAGGRQREHPGLLVHRDRLPSDEVQRLGDLDVTTPLRTAFDLACRLGLVEGVVAVDALAASTRSHPTWCCTWPPATVEHGERPGSPRSRPARARRTCCATSGATRGWLTKAGGSTATRSTRCAASSSASPRS